MIMRNPLFGKQKGAYLSNLQPLSVYTGGADLQSKQNLSLFPVFWHESHVWERITVIQLGLLRPMPMIVEVSPIHDT